MRRYAKKPIILKLKKEVALLVLKKCEQIDYHRHPWGCYWKGSWKFEDKIICITWQNYVSTRRDVDYIHFNYKDGYHFNTIFKKELLRIKNELTK
jgi:hypothetical protein